MHAPVANVMALHALHATRHQPCRALPPCLQVAAQRLAICNDIGEASYLDASIAAILMARIRGLPHAQPILERMHARYGADPNQGSPEDYVVYLADKLFHGQIDKAGQRILNDYRTGLLGQFAIEHPSDVGATAQFEKLEAQAAAAVAEEKSDGGLGAGTSWEGVMVQ